jgi:hypothetical protein
VVARQLRDLGLASLFFDYTGVGLSPGERSVANLLPDARLAWDEALRRTGGDPQRVVIRAISIGTIAAAELLDAGARPRAVFWISPVFPYTVVPRFAREFDGWFAWLAASLLYGPVTRVDPCDVIARCGVPCHLFGSVKDGLVSTDECADLIVAAAHVHGMWHERGGDHLFLGILARRICGDELELFEGLAPPCAGRIQRVLGDMPRNYSSASRRPEGAATSRRAREDTANGVRDRARRCCARE